MKMKITVIAIVGRMTSRMLRRNIQISAWKSWNTWTAPCLFQRLSRIFSSIMRMLRVWFSLLTSMTSCCLLSSRDWRQNKGKWLEIMKMLIRIIIRRIRETIIKIAVMLLWNLLEENQTGRLLRLVIINKHPKIKRLNREIRRISRRIRRISRKRRKIISITRWMNWILRYSRRQR